MRHPLARGLQPKAALWFAVGFTARYLMKTILAYALFPVQSLFGPVSYLAPAVPVPLISTRAERLLIQAPRRLAFTVLPR